MKKTDIKTAFRDSIPVMTGYIVLGMGFGVIMKVNGFSTAVAVIMSIIIYAGSMQYAAVGLLTSGASIIAVALTTLAVNARHLFYGISMLDKYKHTGRRKPYLIFALTDETYSLVCEGNKSKDYCLFVSLFNHFYWVFGTFLGCVIGGILNFDPTGIDFALTALFITVFVSQWLSSENHFPALVGVGASVLCLIFFGSSNFLIPAMLIIAVVILVNMKKENENG